MQIIEKHNRTYYHIGHTPNIGDQAVEASNYLWVWNKKKILVKKEDKYDYRHPLAFPYICFNKTYYGRYNPKKKELSIFCPIEGVCKYRKVPSQILFRLYKQFSETEVIFVFPKEV